MPSRRISTGDLATIGVYVWTFPAFRDAISTHVDTLDDESVIVAWQEFTGRLDNVADSIIESIALDLDERGEK